MRGLRRELDDAIEASWRYHNLEEGIKMFDRVVNAGAEVLKYYAELAALDPDGARTILPEADARTARKQVLDYGCRCSDGSAKQIEPLYADRLAKCDLFEKLRSKASPDQLSNIGSSVAKSHKDCLEWLKTWASRKEQMRIACAATVNLCPDGPAVLRRHTGSAFIAKVARLEARLAAAQFELSRLAGTCEAAASELFRGENEGMRQLQRSMSDIHSAIESTGVGALNKGDRLDTHCLDVVGGVSERLLEIGSALHSIIVRLSDQRIGADLPLTLLKQIEQEAWDTADHAAGFLAIQPPPPTINTSPADSGLRRRKALQDAANEKASTNRPLGPAVRPGRWSRKSPWPPATLGQQPWFSCART
ncbi:hypothetical protein ACFIOY_18270 [Bradyrhizobium sp. TZ2]